MSLSLSLFKSSSKDSFFIGLEKGQKRKKHCERETSNGCLPYTPRLGNRTCNPGLCPDHKWTRNVLVINQLSHISQGSSSFYKDIYSILRVPPSWPNLTLITSQRSHPQSHWRLELQHMIWGWVHKLTVYSTQVDTTVIWTCLHWSLNLTDSQAHAIYFYFASFSKTYILSFPKMY